MPAAAKPARLWLKPRSDGASFWYIKTPSGERIATGIPALNREAAESALSAYLVERHTPPSERAQRPDSIKVADVLNLYVQTAGPRVSRPEALGGRVSAIADFFGTMTLAEINSRSCAAYTAQRGSEAAARRELEDLRAAINLHRKEGLSAAVIPIALPAKAPARERWLSRGEAARLIWAAWRYRQPQHGKETPRRSRQHIARFAIVALYTGSRSAAILDASFVRQPGRGYVDLENGLFYRLAEGESETSKRRPTIRVPTRLLAHMRRWHANGARHVIEHDGQAVASIKKSFAANVAAAEEERVANDGVGVGASLLDVTPHSLRHTAVTWAMQNGVNSYDAGGFFGLSAGLIQRTYGHHGDDHLNRVGEALTRSGTSRSAVRDRFGTAKREQTVINVSERDR
jgi:integrase